jgi:glucose-1-phosphate adenylyltransferase
MDLLKPEPPLNLYQKDWAIRTYHGQNPPARMVPGESGKDGLLTNSILGSGTVIFGGIVRHSILAASVHVHEDAEVDDSILFDHVTVGHGAKLRGCIVDKEVSIPPGETIGFDPAKDSRRFRISEKGVIVVPKEYRFEG